MMNDFPRILLLTPAQSDGSYASGEVMRNIVRALPCQCVVWAGLRQGKQMPEIGLLAEASFPARNMHWRLRNSLPGMIYRREVDARRRASEISEWAKQFAPEILWVLAEEEAINVAGFLKDKLDIPMHLTVHDAPEVFARDFGQYSSVYCRLYLRRFVELVKKATSFDSVSQALVAHVMSLGRMKEGSDVGSLVFPPSTCGGVLKPGVLPQCYDTNGKKRKIGFCGSPRVSEDQWLQFIQSLASLPFEFELIVFSDKDYFFKAQLPENVLISMQGYAATEDEIIKSFIDHGVHACYLGLWRDDSMRLFCRTSLSSKLATYVSTGIPVIVDGPHDSVAWGLINQYGAGILLGAEREESVASLRRLFDDAVEWRRMSDSARRMRTQEFNLAENIISFEKLLTKGVVYAK